MEAAMHCPTCRIDKSEGLITCPDCGATLVKNKQADSGQFLEREPFLPDFRTVCSLYKKTVPWGLAVALPWFFAMGLLFVAPSFGASPSEGAAMGAILFGTASIVALLLGMLVAGPIGYSLVKDSNMPTKLFVWLVTELMLLFLGITAAGAFWSYCNHGRG